jgi:hypothetical protein
MAALSTLFPLALLGRQALAYTWPNPQMEALDAMRYEQLGAAGFQSGIFTFPCDQFVEGTGISAGRINAADWLRTVSFSGNRLYVRVMLRVAQAYHDMATHNATAGTVR